MANFKWPDDPADALKLPNTNVYIDGSASMSRRLTEGLSAFKHAVAWASRERGGFQRLYAYNSKLGVAVHHHEGFGEFPNGGDGAYYMLNHAWESKRRFIVITDAPEGIREDLAKRQSRLGRWALIVIGGTTSPFAFSGENAPGAIYDLPEPNSAAKAADSMARASREAVEMHAGLKREMPREELLGPVSPAISEAHNNPNLARSYMETLAEALMTDPHLSLERGRRPYAHELAEQVLEAKRKREREEVLLAFTELSNDLRGGGQPAYMRAISKAEPKGEPLTYEYAAALSRLWRSLKPVHDFVKEALGE